MKEFKFGKYRGKSLDHVAKHDPSYFQWALENVNGFRELAAGIKPKDDRKVRTLDMRSSSRHGGIKNAGFAPPGQKKFVSKAVNPYTMFNELRSGHHNTEDSPPW